MSKNVVVMLKLGICNMLRIKETLYCQDTEDSYGKLFWL